MAVATDWGPRPIDVRQITGLLDGYTQGRNQRSEWDVESGRKEALKDLPRGPDGSIDFGTAAARLLQLGDIAGGTQFARLSEASAERDANRGFRERALGLQERGLDIQAQRAALGNVPSGFQRSAGGGLEPIPGGPASTEYKSSAARRPLPQNTVNALSEAGAQVTDLNRLTQGWKDEYGGWKSDTIGDAANALARKTGFGNEEAALWWQDYQNQKNAVRKQLFGSALTATEKAEFEKATIAPGMTPQAIRANLKLQQEAAIRAARKLASYYTRSGYDGDGVEAAIGVPLSELGIEGNAPAQPQAIRQPQQQQKFSEGQTATNPQTGQKLRYQGGQWVPAQ